MANKSRQLALREKLTVEVHAVLRFLRIVVEGSHYGPGNEAHQSTIVRISASGSSLPPDGARAPDVRVGALRPLTVSQAWTRRLSFPSVRVVAAANWEVSRVHSGALFVACISRRALARWSNWRLTRRSTRRCGSWV